MTTMTNEKPLTPEEKIKDAVKNIKDICPTYWRTIENMFIKEVIPSLDGQKDQADLAYSYIQKGTIASIMEKLDIKVGGN